IPLSFQEQPRPSRRHQSCLGELRIPGCLAGLTEELSSLSIPKKQSICIIAVPLVVLPQLEWRKRSSVKIMERTYEERAQALHCGREGCGSEAASFGQGASFGPVRRTEPEADGILPLAKGVLRERSGCLSGSRASPSPGGGEAET